VVAAADRVKRRALLAAVAAATAGAVALRGFVTKDRQDPEDHQDRARPVKPLERRPGYQEHKRDCLDLHDRRETRERSCRAWQEMLAEERERLALEEAASARPGASAPEPR
jgi:hypothetical protein